MKYLAKHPTKGPSYALTIEEMVDPKTISDLGINNSWVVRKGKLWTPIHQFLEYARPISSQPGNQRSTVSSAQFVCIACTTELRIPLAEGIARCPICKVGFRITRVNQQPETFLVVPQSQPKTQSTTECGPDQAKLGVRSSFALLGLDETGGLAEARAEYRKLIQAYHPDKVSHLGSELRKLAEVKTKQLNEAMSIINATCQS